MRPEPRLMVAIVSAITAYLQLEQKAGSAPSNTQEKTPANQSTSRT